LLDKWVCLACLEPHDEPSHCDRCNEFTTCHYYVATGPDDSGYLICPGCDSERG
jgi:hypothetical protein